MTWPPPDLRRAATLLAPGCPDCARVATVRWSAARGAWVVTAPHWGSCPVRRSARSKRAAERDFADVVAAALHLAHYSVRGELIVTRHRLAARDG
jgi:hypothetical protein